MANELGVSRATLINYEKGHTTITMDALNKLKSTFPGFDEFLSKGIKEEKAPIIKNNILDLKWPAIRNWSLDAFTSNKNFDKILGYKIPFSPDIIHILDWINLHPSILIALKNLNVPIVRHIFNFEDLCYFHQPIFRHNNQKHCKAPLTPNDCASCISKNTIKK